MNRPADFVRRWSRTCSRLAPVQLIGARLVVEPRAADVGEEHAADAADDADRRQRRLDQREAQLGVGEHGVLSGELQVVVAAQLRVAAEVGEVRDTRRSS